MHNNPNVNVLFQKYTKQLTYYRYNRPKKPTQPINFSTSGGSSPPLPDSLSYRGGDLEESDCFGPPRFGTSAKIMEIWTCADGKMFMSTFFLGGGPSPILVEHVRSEKQKTDGWKIRFLSFWDTVSPSCQVPCCAAKLMRWNWSGMSNDVMYFDARYVTSSHGESRWM